MQGIRNEKHFFCFLLAVSIEIQNCVLFYERQMRSLKAKAYVYTFMNIRVHEHKYVSLVRERDGAKRISYN